jgi:hypothetical protein
LSFRFNIAGGSTEQEEKQLDDQLADAQEDELSRRLIEQDKFNRIIVPLRQGDNFRRTLSRRRTSRAGGSLEQEDHQSRRTTTAGGSLEQEDH